MSPNRPNRDEALPVPRYRRFPLWALLFVVAVSGLAFFGIRLYLRYQANRTVSTVVYSVDDLAQEDDTVRRLISRIQVELDRRDWVESSTHEDMKPFASAGTRAVLVRSNHAGHDRIVGLLRQTRRTAVKPERFRTGRQRADTGIDVGLKPRMK